MTTGIGLLYVGAALLINGVGMLQKIDLKALGIINLIVGFLFVGMNVINLAYAVFTGAETLAYYNIAVSLLFGITYLMVGFTNWFGLDGRPLAWYCFFVVVNAVPVTILSFLGGDTVFGTLWIFWAFLWLIYWIGGAFPKATFAVKLMPWSSIILGVVTIWAPGFLLIAGLL